MATNNQIMAELAKINAKLDVSIVVNGLASKDDLDSLKERLDNIEQTVNTQ